MTGEPNTGALAGVNVEDAVELAKRWLDSVHPDIDPRDAYTLATAVIQMSESGGFWGRAAARLTKENKRLEAELAAERRRAETEVKRRNRPLSVKVVRGVLTIEIGVDVLAHATLNSPATWDADPSCGARRADERYSITDNAGFAEDVATELTSEKEDGSSPISDLLDAVCQEAIDNDSIHFHDEDAQQ